MNEVPVQVSRRDAGRRRMLVRDHLSLPQCVWLVADNIVPPTYLVQEAEVQLADGYPSVLIGFSRQNPPYLFLR